MAHRRRGRVERSRREAQIELSAAELAELDAAIAEADRSESISSATVLAELARIVRAAE